MAERYEVGSGYTKRQRIRATIDPDGMRAVMDALAASSPDVQGRIADLERRAAAHLKNANMPLDLRSPIYRNPAWLRENERKSLDWYAFSILNTIRMLRKQSERGELWNAVDFALDLGVLATEACGMMKRGLVCQTQRWPGSASLTQSVSLAGARSGRILGQLPNRPKRDRTVQCRLGQGWSAIASRNRTRHWVSLLRRLPAAPLTCAERIQRDGYLRREQTYAAILRLRQDGRAALSDPEDRLCPTPPGLRQANLRIDLPAAEVLTGILPPFCRSN
jgi:hypothetical protein